MRALLDRHGIEHDWTQPTGRADLDHDFVAVDTQASLRDAGMHYSTFYRGLKTHGYHQAAAPRREFFEHMKSPASSRCRWRSFRQNVGWAT